MVVRRGRLRQLEDRDRHGLQGMCRVPGCAIADADRGGEEQRRGLTGDPGDGEHGSRHDAADRLWQDDPERCSPARNPEAERRFAQRVGHEREHLDRGAGDERQHQHGERE